MNVLRYLILSLLALANFLCKSEEIYEYDELKKRFFEIQPPINFQDAQYLSSKCKDGFQTFLMSLNSFELWALQMHDATAKISSGVLTGNVNQLGNFDQCLNIIATNETFQGKYCLAELKVTVKNNDEYLKYLRSLALSYETFKGDFNNPKHLVAKNSLIKWALCVPSFCTNSDVELILQTNLNNFTKDTPLNFDVNVDESSCQVKDESQSIFSLGIGTIIAILIFVVIFFTSVISTIYEYYAAGKNQYLTAFSMINNFKQFTNTNRSANDIKIVHSLRFINCFLLLLSHKAMVTPLEPHFNQNDLTEFGSGTLIIFARCSYVFTESFLLISAVLSTYSYFNKFSKGQSINYLKEYIGRYMRIFPSIGALMLFVTFISPLLGSGPMWNTIVTRNVEICQQNWWRNIFFIQNYFGFSNTCLFYTYHTALDTQLFLFAPIISTLIWKWPKKGCCLIFIVILLSAVARYIAVNVYQVDVFLSFGMSIENFVKLFDISYSKPFYRLSSYCIGILLGYFLHINKSFKFSKIWTGWTLVPIFFSMSFLGPFIKRGKFSENDSVVLGVHSAVAPIVWCIMITWIIYSAEKGPKNYFHKFLEWKGFLILGRLSYAIYLIQFLVLYYNVAVIRTSQYFNLFTIAISYTENTMIFLISFILMMFIEYPFINIKRLLLDKPKPN